MTDLAQKNLLMAKVLTTLPERIVVGKLAPESCRFSEYFHRELSLTSQASKGEYLRAVDDLLDGYLASYRSNDTERLEDDLLAIRQRVKAFFT